MLAPGVESRSNSLQCEGICQTGMPGSRAAAIERDGRRIHQKLLELWNASREARLRERESERGGQSCKNRHCGMLDPEGAAQTESKKQNRSNAGETAEGRCGDFCCGHQDL